MKKLWKKFKSWLIRKLGGHEAKVVTFEKMTVPAVTIKAQMALDSHFDDEQWIITQLLPLLADELRPYIKLRYADDFMNYPGRRIYLAEAKVADLKERYK